MTDVGPHLLGRIPSPPDGRDYRLANFQQLGQEAPPLTVPELAQYAITELQQTTVTYKYWAARHYDDVTTTHWWKAFNALSQIVHPPPLPPTENKIWDVTRFQLDQSDTGHCVGFGFAGWSDAEPVLNNYANNDGHAIYYECKIIEGNPGNEDGAYVRDGAKAMLARERLNTYAFADTTADIVAWLRQHGPLVVGTDWTEDMFEPDDSGFARPTGSVAGGHCYLLYGVENDSFIFKNSWGNSWGDNGSFRMKIADFETLMDNYGEAVASVELPL